jgi:hypothetical protein
MPLQTRQIGKRAKESLSAWDAATKEISCFFGLLRCGEIPGLDVLAAHESCVHAVVEAICVGIPALRPAHRLDLHQRVDGQKSRNSPSAIFLPVTVSGHFQVGRLADFRVDK